MLKLFEFPHLRHLEKPDQDIHWVINIICEEMDDKSLLLPSHEVRVVLGIGGHGGVGLLQKEELGRLASRRVLFFLDNLLCALLCHLPPFLPAQASFCQRLQAHELLLCFRNSSPWHELFTLCAVYKGLLRLLNVQLFFSLKRNFGQADSKGSFVRVLFFFELPDLGHLAKPANS